MSKNSNKSTPISEFGEFGLIKHLTNEINIEQSSTIKGIGDDCAVISPNAKNSVVSTEIFTEGVHFNLMYFPLKHLGFKCVTAAISDIVAMNAIPTQILVSIALSSKFSVEAVEQIYDGFNSACEHYHIDFVGGDTTSSLTGLVINVTAIGEANSQELVYRNGAKKNDLICVTGDLGGAYMGLQLLERENEVFKANPNEQPKLEGYDYIVRRQLSPLARTDMKEHFFSREVHPTSMIDISDGLASELKHLATESNCGCRIYEQNIPIDDQTKQMAEEFSINPLVAALNGGEDFELLFTIPVSEHDKVKNDPNITVLGHVVEANEGVGLMTGGGSLVELTAQGWKTPEE
ncbi:thiamine-phosphate kinase [Prolixibacteraceae bacterium JC049]|nr:thiamine-phosphate kinase [Prolixibacteraceae bacterium JC049]